MRRKPVTAPAGAGVYSPPIVTLVAAPSTRMRAALGARLTVPRPLFLIAPVMLTLLASAPPVRLTGMPPIVVHGQKLLATDTRLPPLPPNPIRAPFTLSMDPPLKLRSAPLSTLRVLPLDRKSTRLNSSHLVISYAVFCLKK